VTEPVTAENSAPRQRRRRRPVLTDTMIAALPRKPVSYIKPDPECPKLNVRIHPATAAAFTVICRDDQGRQKWVKIGTVGEMTIEQAREKARTVIQRIKKGLPAEEPPPPPEPVADSVAVVASEWIELHVRSNGLRTADELERICDRYITPNIGNRPFAEIKRSDITKLLDKIQKDHGPGMADQVLSTLRSIAVWFMKRSDDYTPPFTRDMRRTPKSSRKRKRTLDDNEIRAIWQAADEAGMFGDVIKLLLLTAQRRDKVLTMQWSDISKDGVWTVQTELNEAGETREKGNIGRVKLPKVALDIIKRQPRFVGNDYVFAGNRGPKRFDLAKEKNKFDDACGVRKWRLHDLRRTARTLMSRAKVDKDHAEMSLGHALEGVRGTYDRFAYIQEKSHVLAELAALLELIINPLEGNVVQLHEAGEVVA